MAVRPRRGSPKDAVVTVRDALLRGCTWRAAVAGTGLSRTTARRRLWAAFPRVFRDARRRTAPIPLSSRERAAIVRAVLASRLSYRAIARRHNRSPDTVSRLARGLIDAGGGELVTRRVRHAVTCPGCGVRIVLVPCVRCAAMAAPGRTDGRGGARAPNTTATRDGTGSARTVGRGRARDSLAPCQSEPGDLSHGTNGRRPIADG